MLTIGGKLKCDYCGKFIKHGESTIVITPDSYYTIETIEDYHSKCYDELRRK